MIFHILEQCQSTVAIFQCSLEPIARKPSQGPSSRSGHSVDSLPHAQVDLWSWITPSLPHGQVGLCLSGVPLPDRSPLSSLSSFRPKRHEPCSLSSMCVDIDGFPKFVWHAVQTSVGPWACGNPSLGLSFLFSN